MKKIFMLIAVVMLGVGLTGCFATDELSVFIRTAGNDVTQMERYDGVASDQLNEQMVNQLNFDHVSLLSLSVTLTDEMTNHEKIEYIIELYQDISAAHTQNTLIRSDIKAFWTTLQDNVTLFKDSEQVLSDADKTILTDYKVILSIRGLEVKDTIGDIQELLQEVKNNFDYEHLDLIITNLEQILAIQTLRYDFMIYLQNALIDVNNHVLEYLT